MTTPERDQPARRPWHLWLVTVTFFALNVGGARDYALILSQNTDYILQNFGPGGVGYFTDYPVVLRLLWTLNIAGGLIAPLLLVARRSWSVPVAVVAAGAQILLLLITFTFRDRWQVLGNLTSWFDIGVGAIAVFFGWYCWLMYRRGVLQ